MDLKRRLQQLQGQRGNTSAPAPDPGLSVSDRINRLALPTRGSDPHRPVDDEAVAKTLGGELLLPGLIRVDRCFALDEISKADFTATALQQLRSLADAEQLELSDLLFLDTETTGLAGGTGTLAFLVGMARIEDNKLRLRQWFLTGFKAEAAMLADIEHWLQGHRHLVSFNGKSFDIPLLSARYRLARLPTLLGTHPHLDLLHSVRRAFGKQWPDCRLQTAEQQLLALQREDDLPGYLVPEIWSRFVRRGTLAQVPDILRHNLQDLLSLAALLTPLSRTYFQPGYATADRLAIARYLQQRGLHALARQQLQYHIDNLNTTERLTLAELHRRCGAWPEAVAIWQVLASEGHALAMEHLAKYHEHRERNYRQALHWTEHLLRQETESKPHQIRKARLLTRIEAQ